MKKLEFTQEVKDKWLKALKSGKYRQGTRTLYADSDNSYCCIGVLGDIHPKLSNYDKRYCNPYDFLGINDINYISLIQANDNKITKERDYSCVIPLIEKLPVK